MVPASLGMKMEVGSWILYCWQRFGSSTDRFQASSGKHNHKKQQIAKSERESQLFTKNTGAQGSFPPAHPPTPLALACPRPPWPPLPPPACSPGSFWSPWVGTTLTTGCWWNSAFEFINSALDLLILTPSFTCRTKHEWKFPTTSMDSIHLPTIEHKCDPIVYTRIPVQDALAMKRKRLCRGSDGAAPLWQDTLMESIS